MGILDMFPPIKAIIVIIAIGSFKSNGGRPGGGGGKFAILGIVAKADMKSAEFPIGAVVFLPVLRLVCFICLPESL